MKNSLLKMAPPAAVPKSQTFEPYVGPEAVAEFLGLSRLAVVRMARAGKLPAHPLGDGQRRQWRFKISEVDKQIQGGITSCRPPVCH